ncbi:two-pore potassium channel 4-like [Prunus avium]|uniref:Two-pore potassium channel 4-like n=1 Tax=Prunus avium TaxID=42229 RepID=A0A6P5SG90_PRUAV|nr:two-pore potassium channel 4-like [Prunus avium]
MPNMNYIIVYFILGVLLFWNIGKSLLEGFYGTVVILTSVGYGDLVPLVHRDKFLMCVLISIGFFFVADCVEDMFDYIHYKVVMWLRQKEWYSNVCPINLLLAVIGISLLLGSGTVAIRFIEGMSWTDAFYLTVASVTTVGFGDKHFQSTGGQCFAIFWLLLSTSVAKRLSKWLNAQINHMRFSNMDTRSQRRE